MKLCIVTEYFDNTGSTPTVLSDLAAYLRRAHPELSVDVIASRNVYRGEAKLSSGVTGDGVRVTRLNTPKSNTSSTAIRLALGTLFSLAAAMELLSRNAYDLTLVVTNPPAAPIAARLAARIRGTRYVYLIHDLYPDVAIALGVVDSRGPAARMLRMMQRGWLHSAARVVVLGRCMRDYLQNSYDLPSSRIDVITNWADPDAIRPEARSAFREKHGLTGVVVLYSGNFGYHQQFDDVLSAAGRIRDVDSQVTFVLVGNGAREQEIRHRVETDNLTNVRVFPLVPSTEYSDLLASADIALVLLAAGMEGLGVPSKFYNILASGRPTIAVVAPDSEIACVLRETDSGISVRPGDADGLADAVELLAGNSARRAVMGDNARQALLRSYTLEHVGERFWKVFTEVGASPPE